MQLTKHTVRLSTDFLVRIPDTMKGVWDLSENRWGYKKVQ